MADTDVVIGSLEIRARTGGDDKDRGDAVLVKLIAKNGEVIGDTGWQHDGLVFRDDSNNIWQVHLNRRFTLAEAKDGMKLYVEKTGDKGWFSFFTLTGTATNGVPFALINATPLVLFGKRVNVTIDLTGSANVKIENGEVKFTAEAQAKISLARQVGASAYVFPMTIT